MNAADLSDKRDQAIEEITTAAGNAEQARQLRHNDGQPRTGLEADQNAVADQPHQQAEPEEPGDQAKSRDGKGSNTRNLGIADRIARREGSDRSRGHQRDRRGRADRKLARRAEQRIADAAQHIAVDADLRRQAGERRIGQRHRDRVSRKRHAGNDIGAKPGGTVFGEPLRGRKELCSVQLHDGSPVQRCSAASSGRAINSSTSSSAAQGR